MNDLIEAIRAAVADGASAEQKSVGAQACRTILAALDTEIGKPLTVPDAPQPHPLARLDPGQALDLLIAKLSAGLPKDEQPATASSVPTIARDRGLRIAFVTPPPKVARSSRRRR
ncbi:MAG: hypothetical protein F9K40_05950 [Kofleriaceae bacterium]|nr:MAG: hypothetical protein F9K40_05950 [Kofleriaceae bacterium]